ncbi:MAG TPA: PilN domain-containing protein [Gemmatimonadaceae bacterium]|nr:PilN domain-containing protein [Gemmatimonadaceae bacterium]
MIEINLLPGAGRKARGGARASGVSLGAAFSGLTDRIRDPFLIAAIAASAVAAAAIGGMYTLQAARESGLDERAQRAQQDSVRYSAVLRDRRRAEAQRDSAMRQLNIIRGIDNTRFVWPHVMDEVSRALPPYTWLTLIMQTSAAPTPVDPAPRAAGAAGAAAAKPDTAQAAPENMKFQIVGQTVDIQALTRFMRQLEASEFIQNVNLSKSDVVNVEGKEITEFTLTAEYQSPDSSAIRTVPLSLQVR